MTSSSGIPRPFSITDAKRAREEEARKREQATSARNTSSTTIGSGGRLDVVGGDLTISDGGNASVKDGGRFLVEGGGSMEITDDGQINVIGNGRGWSSNQLIQVVASFANRMAYNAWIGFSYLVPGLYFTAEGESQGPYDPRVVSQYGKDVSAISAVEKLPYGPQVGPTIMSKGSYSADPWMVGVGAYAWDDAINPGGSDGVAGLRGSGGYNATPYDISMLLTNHTPGPDGIPDGPAVWIHGTLDEGILHLFGRDGVDVKGPFTVDGAPVGGAVDSVAGKTGAVTLVKADVGLGNVDNTSDAAKPVSTATATALSGKASTAVATTTANGLMPSTDKSKVDGATPSPTAFRMMQRDGSGRAQVADPVSGTDIVNYQTMQAAIPKTRLGHYTSTGSKGNAVVANQAIAALTYVAGESTDNLATAGAGKLTIAETGIYSVVCTIRLYAEAALINPKPMTGRSFIDITDTAGVALSRTAIPVSEDQATGNNAGILLTAGQDIQFWLYQNSGGTAYYRARIWLTKNP